MSDDLKDLLEGYSVPTTRYRPNLLDIAGFPRRETVYSRLVAFFLSPAQGHGIHEEWLQALANLTRLDLGSVESVETEVNTKQGTFIDILVTTSTAVVAIENKVDAWLYNPLANYLEHAKSLVQGTVRIPYLMVLSRVHQEPGDVPFLGIRYQELATQLRHLIPDTGVVDPYYRGVFEHTLAAIERLSPQGDLAMDTEYLQLYRTHKAAVESLLQRHRALLALTNQLAGRLRDSMQERGLKNVKKTWLYRHGDAQETTVVDFEPVDGLQLAVDVYHQLSGVQVCLFDRSGSIDGITRIEARFALPSFHVKTIPAIDRRPRYYRSGVIPLDRYDEFFPELIDLIVQTDQAVTRFREGA